MQMDMYDKTGVEAQKLLIFVSTEQLMRDSFSEFGTVLDVKVFKDKAFAFIRYFADAFVVDVWKSWFALN